MDPRSKEANGTINLKIHSSLCEDRLPTWPGLRKELDPASLTMRSCELLSAYPNAPRDAFDAAANASGLLRDRDALLFAHERTCRGEAAAIQAETVARANAARQSLEYIQKGGWNSEQLTDRLVAAAVPHFEERHSKPLSVL